VLWALFLLALLMPCAAGAGWTGRLARGRKPFRGRGWAIFALGRDGAAVGLALVGTGAGAHAGSKTQITTAPVKRMALEPYPINPFRWHAILETAEFYQTAEINTRTGEIRERPAGDVIFKPAVTAATEAAKRTPLGQVYLDWGTWAVVRDVGQVPAPGMRSAAIAAPNRVWTAVEFTDLRFDYSVPGPLARRELQTGRL
jgi:inner membrane protein